MKKVLQISTTTLQYDGLTKVLFSLIDNCNRDNCNVEVVLGKGSATGFKDKLLERNIRYYEVPDRETKTLQYCKALYKIIRQGKYDVVHVHGNSATMALDVLIAKICGVRRRIAHSHNTKTNHPIIHSMLRPLLNTVVTCPVACGKDAGAFLYGKRKFQVLPNCIKVSDFAFDGQVREKRRTELGYDKCDFVIGHVGRFSFQKNHEYDIQQNHCLYVRNK